MKPILFNTDMVQAILAGRKTVTRRIAKQINPEAPCQCEGRFDHEFIRDDFLGGAYTGFVCRKCGYGVSPPHSKKYPVGTSRIRPPYSPGDALYVREAWNYAYQLDGKEQPIEETGRFYYAADGSPSFTFWVTPDGEHRDAMPWRPSIHMPREAARIFLRVKDVRVERLHDITEDGAIAEGIIPSGGNFALDDFESLWDSLYARPMPIKEGGQVVGYVSYPWEDVRDSRTYRGKPWQVIGNPWLWAIGLERISKEEALR